MAMACWWNTLLVQVNKLNLEQVANELTERVVSLFGKDATGKRPLHVNTTGFISAPKISTFYSFMNIFHGDTCHGLGASHQTGWTSLIAELISELAGKKALRFPTLRHIYSPKETGVFKRNHSNSYQTPYLLTYSYLKEWHPVGSILPGKRNTNTENFL